MDAPISVRCCETCLHWRLTVGSLKAGKCEFPLPFWIPGCRTTRCDDGMNCKAFESRAAAAKE